MDVLLDSNIYLEDFKMTGNQFTELFTYLRRTGSRILLPHLVLEEVAARYSERLSEASRKARSAHENLWKLTNSDGAQFKEPIVDQEVQALVKRMRLPSKGVRVTEVDDYRAVDFKEVVTRGIHRRRPASERGEELRDVILWLLVLDLAKNSRSGIIFISRDKTFATEDGQNLHPDLLRDISSLKVRLDFYLSIREFVVARALDHESIDADQFYSIVSLRKVEQLTRERMIRSSTRVGNIVTADLKEFVFEHAIRYKVGEGAFFIEVLFGGSAELSIEEVGQYVNYVDVNSLSTENVGKYLTGPLLATKTVNLQTGSIVAQPSDQTVVFGDFTLQNPTILSLAPPKPRKYVCSFRVSLSARVVDDNLESLEVEAIQYKSFLLNEH
jgi:hypothetical protein